MKAAAARPRTPPATITRSQSKAWALRIQDWLRDPGDAQGLNVWVTVPCMPAGRLQTGERASAVRDAIPALPEELRKPLLILAGYQGMPQADIGAVLKCSTKTVETRSYHARQQLRAGLAYLIQP